MNKELQEVNLGVYDAVYRTNVDGIPYVLIDESKDELVIKTKYVMKGNQGMYTLMSVDVDKKVLEFQLDKVLDLTERLVSKVQDFYDGFGIKKTAKCNYVIDNLVHLEFDVEGKLSKNQTVQIYSQIIKITDLIKLENKVVEIKGKQVEHGELVPVYLYKEYKDVLGWFYDWGDMLLHKAREFNKRRNGGI